MSFALLTAGHACALGLGDAVGNAVVGEPLRIEIPLLGSGSETPSPACFRIVPPMGEIGSDFVLRNAHVDVVGERGGSKLIVTTTAAIREPLVGFAVSAGCSFGLTRDYILLSSMAAVAPAAAPVQIPATAPVALTAAPSPQRAETVSPLPTAGGETLRLEKQATLTALARKKYPLQPKAREKFVRMMMQANPALANGDAPIDAGTVLQVPPGLPLRREGTFAPRPGSAAPDRPAAAVAAPSAKPNAKPGKDRLLLSAGPDASGARLLDEAERLTAMMLEQAKAQEELLETIARLEASYGALRKDFAQIENRLNAIEAERKAEKAAASSSISFDLVALLGAVFGGGAMGGLLLHLYQRRKPKRDTEALGEPWWTSAEKAVPVAPRSKLSSAGKAPVSSQQDVLDFHTQPQKTS